MWAGLKRLNKLEMGPIDAVWDAREFERKSEDLAGTPASMGDQKRTEISIGASEGP